MYTYFFQAEDGIRDTSVTGVQTCALPIFEAYVSTAAKVSRLAVGDREAAPTQITYSVKGDLSQNQTIDGQPLGTRGGTEIGRASCRESVARRGDGGELIVTNVALYYS